MRCIIWPFGIKCILLSCIFHQYSAIINKRCFCLLTFSCVCVFTQKPVSQKLIKISQGQITFLDCLINLIFLRVADGFYLCYMNKPEIFHLNFEVDFLSVIVFVIQIPQRLSTQCKRLHENRSLYVLLAECSLILWINTFSIVLIPFKATFPFNIQFRFFLCPRNAACALCIS